MGEYDDGGNAKGDEGVSALLKPLMAENAAATQAISRYGVSVIEQVLMTLEAQKRDAGAGDVAEIEGKRHAIDEMTRVLEWQAVPIMGEPEGSQQKLLDGLKTLRSIKPRARDFGVSDVDLQGLIGLVATVAGIEAIDLESATARRIK